MLLTVILMTVAPGLVTVLGQLQLRQLRLLMMELNTVTKLKLDAMLAAVTTVQLQ